MLKKITDMRMHYKRILDVTESVTYYTNLNKYPWGGTITLKTDLFFMRGGSFLRN